MATVHSLRDKAGDSEKITINHGYVDLGRIDLLVQEDSTRIARTSSARRSATS
jgi:Ribbon-Helix-Helix transcriptional regulator family